MSDCTKPRLKPAHIDLIQLLARADEQADYDRQQQEKAKRPRPRARLSAVGERYLDELIGVLE